LPEIKAHRVKISRRRRLTGKNTWKEEIKMAKRSVSWNEGLAKDL